MNAPSLFTGTASHDILPAFFCVGLVLEAVSPGAKIWVSPGDLFHVHRRHKQVVVLQHERTGSTIRIPFFKDGLLEEHADETWTFGYRVKADENPRFRIRHDLEPHGPEYAETPTRLLRETLQANGNDIEATFAALHKSGSPNASSARSILARTKRRFVGVSHVRYSGGGNFEPIRPNLRVLGWYDDDTENPKDLGPYEGIVIEPGAYRTSIDDNAVRRFLDTLNPRPTYASIRNEDRPETWVAGRLGIALAGRADT